MESYFTRQKITLLHKPHKMFCCETLCTNIECLHVHPDFLWNFSAVDAFTPRRQSESPDFNIVAGWEQEKS